jgi:hypothetical protein
MVRAVKLSAVVLCFALLAPGCGRLYMHNPGKARVTADNFFAYVYKLGDFTTAYSMTNKSFSDNFKDGYLESVVGSQNKKYGKFQGVRPESYFFEGGSRDIELFYTAIFENGVTYQKLMLNGDGQGGYRVSSLVFADKPFTGYRLMKKFSE